MNDQCAALRIPVSGGVLPTADRRLVSDLLRGWPSGVQFDARAVLAENPQLAQHRSVVIDLAYEEYCRQADASAAPAPAEFAARFPSVAESLLRVLEVHQFLDRDSLLLRRLSPREWPDAGQQFLGFRLIEELGRGAFSRVFLAEQEGLGGRLVAVKVCERGAEEARLLGRLQHRHIVPVHSVTCDEETGLFAICMPFLGRRTLQDSVSEARRERAVDGAARAEGPAGPRATRARAATARGLSIEDVVRAGIELSDALAGAHRSGVYHCDIKPSNVLLTDDGRSMLLDFNLSFDAAVGGGPLGGTLPYMAPEQLWAVRGGPAVLDERTDLFALATTLYEALCGKHPFGGAAVDRPRNEAAHELLRRQREGPLPLRRFARNVDRGLARLLETCLAFDPSGRPASAAEFADSLRRVAARRSLRRRCLRTLPAVVVCAALAGAAALQVHDQSAGATVEEARETFRQRDYDGTVRLCDRAIGDDAGCDEARLLRAFAHHDRGRHREAGQDLATAAERRPDLDVTVDLAYCLAADGSYAAAAAHYEAILHQRGVSAGILNNLGYCLLGMGDHSAAYDRLSEAARVDGTLQPVFHNLAVAAHSRAVRLRAAAGRDPSVAGDLDAAVSAAVENVGRALSLGPRSAELCLDAACVYAAAAGHAVDSDPALRDECAEKALAACESALAEGLPASQLSSVRVLLQPLPQKVQDRLSALPAPASPQPLRRAHRLIEPPSLRDPASALSVIDAVANGG